MTTPLTDRDKAKAARRQALLSAAARLFAERGYGAVSLDDLGAAVGVSGPAVYRHFPGKQALLAELLIGVSEGLVAGSEHIVSSRPENTLSDLVRFHVNFAIDSPDVIRVQDRDLASLDSSAAATVRSLQRSYVHRWVAVLGDVLPDLGDSERLVRVHAAFGLMNSTPYSVRARGNREREAAAGTLHASALAALTVVPVS